MDQYISDQIQLGWVRFVLKDRLVYTLGLEQQ